MKETVSVAEYLSNPRSNPPENPFLKKAFREKPKNCRPLAEAKSYQEDPPTFESLRHESQLNCSVGAEDQASKHEAAELAKIDHIFDLVAQTVQSYRVRCKEEFSRSLAIKRLARLQASSEPDLHASVSEFSLQPDREKISLNKQALGEIETALADLCKFQRGERTRPGSRVGSPKGLHSGLKPKGSLKMTREGGGKQYIYNQVLKVWPR